MDALFVIAMLVLGVGTLFGVVALMTSTLKRPYRDRPDLLQDMRASGWRPADVGPFVVGGVMRRPAQLSWHSLRSPS